MELKKVLVIIGLITGITTVSGILYKSVTTVNTKVIQIDTNTRDIVVLSTKQKIAKLKELLAEARAERNFLRRELRKDPNNEELREKLEEAEEEVADLKAQISELEKEVG